MKKNLVFLVLILVLLLLGIFVFSHNKSNPITIGLAMPFTGAAADTGEYSKNAALLAEEEINQGANKTKVRILFEDSKYQPQGAVSAVKKLLELDQVKYLVGPYSSAEVEATAPLAEARKVVMVVPGAQSEDISRLGDYIFRLIHNTAQEAPVFAEFVNRNMEGEVLDFLVVKVSITEPYLKSFRPTFEKDGKRIGLIDEFDPTTTDFRPFLTKLKAQNHKTIFLISPPKLTGLILKQAGEMGLKQKFFAIGVESPELVKIAGERANGLIYPYSYDVHSGNPEVRDFAETYQKRFGVEPDAVAANTYDSIMLLYRCAVSNNEPSVVRDCLYQTRNYTGASGTFSINQNGDAVRSIFIKTIREGKFEKL